MHTKKTRSRPFPSVLPRLATWPPQAVAAWVVTDPVQIKSWPLKDIDTCGPLVAVLSGGLKLNLSGHVGQPHRRSAKGMAAVKRAVRKDGGQAEVLEDTLEVKLFIRKEPLEVWMGELVGPLVVPGPGPQALCVPWCAP